MKTKKVLRKSAGIAGLICVIVLSFHLLICLGDIFYTPHSEGQGDYYDPTRDAGVDEESSPLLLLFYLFWNPLPLFLLFYPLLKLFVSMMLNRTRKAYYGLFVAGNLVTRVLSVALSILNIFTIIWFTYDLSVEADRIDSWNYDTALCPDHIDLYISYILRIIGFWGIVHLAHGIYHHIILKRKNYNSDI